MASLLNTATDLNVVLAIISAVAFIIKLSMAIGNSSTPFTSLALHRCSSLSWEFSFSGQLSADYTEPEHLSPEPWYLVRSCSVLDGGFRTTCVVVKATFGVIAV